MFTKCKYEYLLTIVVITSGLILYLPAVIYSLLTHFALVDDYNAWFIVRDFSTWHGIKEWLKTTLTTFGHGRFRPMFELYNLLTWSLFGSCYQLHHLMRILLKAATIVFTSLTIRQYCNAMNCTHRINSSILAFTILFMFFPNTPEARLGPQETLVVFFLSIAIYALIREIYNSKQGHIGNCLLSFVALFFLSCSKETAIPLSLTITLFFILVTILKNRKSHIWIYILSILLQSWAICKVVTVIDNGGYGVKKISEDLIYNNIPYYLSRLLLLKTSAVFGIVFLAMPFLFVLIHSNISLFQMAVRHIKKRTLHLTEKEWSSLVLYIVCLLLIVSFLVSLTSWTRVLRYVYPSVYLLCLVMGLFVAHLRAYRLKRVVAYGCLLFMAINSYNFLYQYAVQYTARQAEYYLLQEMRTLLDKGNQVVSVADGEQTQKLLDYFNQYLPFYEGYTKKIQLVNPNQPVAENVDFCVCPEYSCKKGAPPPGFVKYKEYILPTGLKALEITKMISSIFSVNIVPFSEHDAGAKPYAWYLFKRSRFKKPT